MESISKELESVFMKLGKYYHPASTHTGFWLFIINGQKISYYPNNDNRFYVNGVCFGIVPTHEDALDLITAFARLRSADRMFIMI